MRRKSFKISIVLLCIIMIAVVLSGCGSAAISRPSQSPGVTTVKVTGTCDIAVKDGVVTVSGKTNLPDGALIQIAVLGQDGLTIDSFKMNKSGDVSHDFKIADKAEAYAKVSSVNGSVYGFITCAPKLYGEQKAEIYTTYGDKFQNIDYNDAETKTHYIWDKEGNIIIFQSNPVDLSK